MDTDDTPTGQAGDLPVPSRSSGWRWATTRSAALCGGALVGVLAFGGVAGAGTTHTGKPPAGQGPRPGQGARPTAAGKITALPGDGTITIATRTATETVDYSSTTTFATSSGASTASALKVGDFIAVRGTKASNGDIAASAIMIGSGPPGRPPGQGRPPKGGRGSTG